jgi:hypothetical protein
MGVLEKFRRKPAAAQDLTTLPMAANGHSSPNSLTDKEARPVELENRTEPDFEGAVGDVEVANGTRGPAPTIDVAAEKRLVRKVDWNMVPLVSALYLLAFLDRSNIGNAKIAGMAEDLAIGDRYNWLLTIFYISYILFEWFAMMWKILPPHVWAATVVLGW